MIRSLHYWTEAGSQLPTDIGVSQSVPRHLIPYLHQAVKPPFPGACLNACALAYLGGEYRFMDYGSQYRVNPAAAAGSDVANYVSEMGVTGVGPGINRRSLNRSHGPHSAGASAAGHAPTGCAP